jgi:hypothetical protein
MAKKTRSVLPSCACGGEQCDKRARQGHQANLHQRTSSKGKVSLDKTGPRAAAPLSCQISIWLAGLSARSPTLLRWLLFLLLRALLDGVSSFTCSSECCCTVACGAVLNNGRKGLFSGKSYSPLRVPDLTFSFEPKSATVASEGPGSRRARARPLSEVGGECLTLVSSTCQVFPDVREGCVSR